MIDKINFKKNILRNEYWDKNIKPMYFHSIRAVAVGICQTLKIKISSIISCSLFKGGSMKK